MKEKGYSFWNGDENTTRSLYDAIRVLRRIARKCGDIDTAEACGTLLDVLRCD